MNSWMEEYYPKEASNVSEEDALEHSLQKWIGLRDENLKKHGCWKEGRTLYEEEGKPFFDVDGSNCALCLFYKEPDSQTPECEVCPLKEEIGKPCDVGVENPWDTFVREGNPEPMIRALERCLKKESTPRKNDS